jgi:hypothetical protein
MAKNMSTNCIENEEMQQHSAQFFEMFNCYRSAALLVLKGT